MRAFLFCLALALSGAAAAQTTTTGLSLDFNGQTTFTVGLADCGNQISINWNATPAGTVCSDLRIWITTGQCGNTPGASDYELRDNQLAQANWQVQRSGTVQASVSSLPIFTQADGGSSTCPQQLRDTLSVCAAYQYAALNGFTVSCSSPTTVTATPLTLTYAGVPPAVPSITSVTPLDSALQVSVSADSNTSLVHVRYGTDVDGGMGAPIASTSFSPDQGSVKLTGLVNGTPYYVQASAEDAAGNVSDWSAVTDQTVGTPIYTEGFFDKYKRLGGEEQGGCTTAVGGPWIWTGGLLLAGFFFARRRRG